jgi:hypothetical protein
MKLKTSNIPIKKFFLVVIYFLLLLLVSNAQINKYTISGYVHEDKSLESLIGVNVYVPSLKVGTTTNTYGFFSLTLPAADSLKILVSYVGFTPQEITINLNENKEINVSLKAEVLLKEVTVVGHQNIKQSETVKMSTISVPIAQVKSIPSLLGEKDVLKVIQLMPGVQKGMEGSSGFYVRGGGPDQNLIILDDAIVYNVSHLFGFFSLFNGDALKSVELTKGGFPARYGGRLSSVLEMNMKEGNKEKWSGEGGIGFISSRLTLEGPIQKGKSSILVSGRRTYIDLLMQPFMRKDERGGYFFYDLNAKINYDFGRKNKVYLSGYFGRDKFYMVNKTEQVNDKGALYWGNGTGTLRWNHLYNSRLFSNTSFIFSNFKFGIYEDYKVLDEGKDYYAEYYSGIRDFTLKHDFDYIPNPKHTVKAGFISTHHQYEPHAFVEIDEGNDTYEKDFRKNIGLETAVYLEDTYQPVEQLKINPGVRFSHFTALSKQYAFIEPRLSMAWKFNKDIAWKASYAEMNQYIHLLSNTGINLPTDLWVPATERIKPQNSRQISMGLVKDFSKQNFFISIEGYYKQMRNIIGYKEGASFISLDDPETGKEVTWEDNVTVGKGWSYGAEFLLQRKFGKISGWVGYTLSWTQLQFDELNFGKKFYARYDRRHDVSVVCIYKPFNNITISGVWVYGTGNAVTLPVSEYPVFPNGGSDNYYQYNPYYWGYQGARDYEGKNNFRMEAYHRFDFGIQFHKQMRRHERTWEFSVYNAYNRMNPFFYYSEKEWKNNKEYGKLYKIGLFPIIPTVTYSFKF